MKTFFVSLVIAVAFFTPVITIADNPPTGGYSIKIIIKGLKENSNCLLANYYGGQALKVDSAKSNAKGEIIFKGDDKYPQGVYLIQIPSGAYFDFIMDADQHFSLETDITDFVKSMKVKNSEENTFFYDYQRYISKQQKQLQPLQEQYKKIKNNKDSVKLIQDKMTVINTDIKNYKLTFIKTNPKSFVSQLFKAMEEPEIPEAPVLLNGGKDTTFAYHYFKAHFFDAIDFSDERLLRTPVFHSKIKQYMDKLTPQIPDSIIISADYVLKKAKANPEVFKYLLNWITYTYEDMGNKIMGMDAIFVNLVKKYYLTKQASWLDSTQLYKVVARASVLDPILLGKTAPSIVMQDSTGKFVSLHDVKAKYTIVAFWEPGCGHCIKDIPKLAELYKNKLKAEGVEVYAIETINDPKAWKKFINEHQLNWINVNEPDDYKRAVTKKIYDVIATPYFYILDENKVIKAKRIGIEQLDEFLDRLIKDKK